MRDITAELISQNSFEEAGVRMLGMCFEGLNTFAPTQGQFGGYLGQQPPFSMFDNSAAPALTSLALLFQANRDYLKLLTSSNKLSTIFLVPSNSVAQFLSASGKSGGANTLLPPHWQVMGPRAPLMCGIGGN
jgi:hypothetical protein